MDESAFEGQGRIGAHMESTSLTVAPGGSITIPITLLNRGDEVDIPLILVNRGVEADAFTLTVDGIPVSWAFTATAAIQLAPGQQKEATLTIQPPLGVQSQAGVQFFTIVVGSHAVPGQAARADCTLTIGAFTRFNAGLQPQRVGAGQPARVVVENQGNSQQRFTLTWQSPADAGYQEAIVFARECGVKISMLD